jgi:Predicted kinase
MEKEKFDIPENSLVIVMGAPGSGKSTLCEKLSNDERIVVSVDSIREELWETPADVEHNELTFEEFHNRIDKNLNEGKTVIADASSIGATSRQKLYDLAIANNSPIRVILLNIPLDVILQQNASRHGNKVVNTGQIVSMYKNLEKKYEIIDKEVKILPDAKICDIVLPGIHKESDDLDR